ncbi:MAG: MerR family transcriptional regulator [Planctomycetota bacterium]|jgi:excisionase family DNA binding protein
MKELLSPSEVALALGTSESSVRRWCDSGQLTVTRTSGGHRKISRRDTIRFIRQAQWPVAQPHVLSLATGREIDHESVSEREGLFYAALERGDSQAAMSWVESMYLEGIGIAEIGDGPVREAMIRLGQSGERMERAIFLEHRATGICVRILNQVRALMPEPAPQACVALGGGLSNDPFMLPSTLVALVLADLGYRDINLGPDTPWEVIDESARESGAKIVWLSLTAPRPRKLVESEVKQLANKLARRGTHLVLGGRAVRKYRFTPTPTLHVFDSLRELSGFARGILANGTVTAAGTGNR